MSSLTDLIGNAKSAMNSGIKGSATTAAQLAASGDFTGAAAALGNAAQDALVSFGASGGVNPGNGFAGLAARGDAVQNWCWYCLLPDIQGSSDGSLSSIADNLGFSGGAGSQGNLTQTVSLPWYYVQTANAPFRAITAGSVTRNAHQQHYPESYSVEDLNLGFFMDSASKAHQYLRAWSAKVLSNKNPKIFSNRGRFGLPVEYKKDIRVFVLSVDNRTLLQIRYMGCWPKVPQALELTSGSAEAMVQNVSFCVEDVDITVNNNKSLVDNLLNTASGFATTALTGQLSSLIGLKG